MPLCLTVSPVFTVTLGLSRYLGQEEGGLRGPRTRSYPVVKSVAYHPAISVIDKFSLHGKDTSQYLDGGSAYHCNLESYPTKEGFMKLLDMAVKEGCEYFCFNVAVTCCESCGFIDKRTLTKCSKCDSTDLSWATRVIGYLKKIKDFSPDRQKEADLRHYHVS